MRHRTRFGRPSGRCGPRGLLPAVVLSTTAGLTWFIASTPSAASVRAHRAAHVCIDHIRSAAPDEESRILAQRPFRPTTTTACWIEDLNPAAVRWAVPSTTHGTPAHQLNRDVIRRVHAPHPAAPGPSRQQPATDRGSPRAERDDGTIRHHILGSISALPTARAERTLTSQTGARTWTTLADLQGIFDDQDSLRFSDLLRAGEGFVLRPDTRLLRVIGEDGRREPNVRAVLHVYVRVLSDRTDVVRIEVQ